MLFCCYLFFAVVTLDNFNMYMRNTMFQLFLRAELNSQGIFNLTKKMQKKNVGLLGDGVTCKPVTRKPYLKEFYMSSQDIQTL